MAIITDDNESVVARYEYDAFGAVRHQWGNSDNTRKFTGKEYDADVKLYYYGARYYDPYIGRFISRDPAGDGINWYVYCRNNPLSLVDPTGLKLIRERKASDLERKALVLAFGPEVGNYLADTQWIQIRSKEPGEAEYRFEDGYVVLADDYKETNISDLKIFIHEMVHAWQHGTGLHRGRADLPGGGKDYRYTAEQLISNDLNREEQAQAVEDWFYINWGVSTGEFSPDDTLDISDFSDVFICNDTFMQLYKALGCISGGEVTVGFMLQLTNYYYNSVICQIRFARHILPPDLWDPEFGW